MDRRVVVEKESAAREERSADCLNCINWSVRMARVVGLWVLNWSLHKPPFTERRMNANETKRKRKDTLTCGTAAQSDDDANEKW